MFGSSTLRDGRLGELHTFLRWPWVLDLKRCIRRRLPFVTPSIGRPSGKPEIALAVCEELKYFIPSFIPLISLHRRLPCSSPSSFLRCKEKEKEKL